MLTLPIRVGILCTFLVWSHSAALSDAGHAPAWAPRMRGSWIFILELPSTQSSPAGWRLSWESCEGSPFELQGSLWVISLLPASTWPDHWWHLQRKWWNGEVYMTTVHAHLPVLSQREPSQWLLCPDAPRCPPSLVALGFLWVSCFMLFWGVGLWAGLKELVKTTAKMLIAYILCSRLCTSDVTLDFSRPQSLTKIHWEAIAMVWVFAPTTKFKIPNPKSWWY